MKNTNDGMHPGWWAVLICAPLLAIGIGAFLMLKPQMIAQDVSLPAADEKLPQYSEPPARIVKIKPMENTPEPRPVVAPAAPSNDNSGEIARLKTENAKLAAEMQRLSDQINQQKPSQATAIPQAIPPAPAALYASFGDFMKRLAPEFTKKELGTLDATAKVTTTILSEDLKKSDSLIFPTAGVAVVRISIDTHYFLTVTYTIEMGQSKGKWVVSKAMMKSRGLNDAQSSDSSDVTQFVQEIADLVPQ